MFDFLSPVIEWWWEAVTLLPRLIWDGITSALAAVIEDIPVPDFMADIPGLWAQVPAGVWWGLNMFEVPAGLSMIAAALVLRFIIRRLPVIG